MSLPAGDIYCFSLRVWGSVWAEFWSHPNLVWEILCFCFELLKWIFLRKCSNSEIILQLISWSFAIKILSLFQDNLSLKSKLLLYFTIDWYWHLYVYFKRFNLDSFIILIDKSYNILHELSEIQKEWIYLFLFLASQLEIP